MIKNRHPNTEPWGTPGLTNFQLECWPSKTSLYHLLWKMTRSYQEDYHLSYCFLIYTKDLWQTRSNVFAKPRKMPQTSNEGFSSNALKILWVYEIISLIQKWFGLKPDWVLRRRLFSIINSKLALNTIFWTYR